MKNPRRLVEDFQPAHYRLRLTPDAGLARFTGEVFVTGRKIGKPSKRLTFHQKGLKIKNAAVVAHKKAGRIPCDIVRINHHRSFEQVRLHASEILFPGEYEITLRFSGRITSANRDVFRLPANTEKLVGARLAVGRAREIFPCIDEIEAPADIQLFDGIL